MTGLQISRDDRASAQSQLAAFLAAHRHFEQLTLIRPCARVTLNAIMVNLQCLPPRGPRRPPAGPVIACRWIGPRIDCFGISSDTPQRNQLTRRHANTAWACICSAFANATADVAIFHGERRPAFSALLATELAPSLA